MAGCKAAQVFLNEDSEEEIHQTNLAPDFTTTISPFSKGAPDL